MAQIPTAIGLLVCEQVIIEERTHNITLVNCFTLRKIGSFPSEPQRFAVFALLTDGQGDIDLKLVIERLDTGEEIFSQPRSLRFPDPLEEVRFLFRITTCSFPVARRYDVVLFAEGHELARHRFNVV
jgi:hypothetical protein